jgi:hypothetical protein
MAAPGTAGDVPASGVAVIEGSVFEAALRHSIGATTAPYFAHETSPEDKAPFLTFLHALLFYDKITLDANFFDRATTHYWRLGCAKESYRASGWAELMTATDILDRIVEDYYVQRLFVGVYSNKLSRSPGLQKFADELYASLRRDLSFRGDLTRQDFESPAEHPIWKGVPEEKRPACGFLYRSIVYAGFANSYFMSHHIPCVYAASPGRMLGLSEFLTESELRKLRHSIEGYPELLDSSLLTAKFSVPSGGYAFRPFDETLNPILFSAASIVLSALAPDEAIRKIIEFRESKDGQELRREWARRVWAQSHSAAEGILSPRMAVTGSTIAGSLSLTFNQTVFASANWEREMKAKQHMTGVVANGTVQQTSGVELEQIMSGIRAAGDVQQIIRVTSAHLNTVAGELARLIEEIQRHDPGAKTELGHLAAAEEAARAGDGEAVVTRLKGLATWVADFATKVGTTVVAHIIERAGF